MVYDGEILNTYDFSSSGVITKFKFEPGEFLVELSSPLKGITIEGNIELVGNQ